MFRNALMTGQENHAIPFTAKPYPRSSVIPPCSAACSRTAPWFRGDLLRWRIGRPKRPMSGSIPERTVRVSRSVPSGLVNSTTAWVLVRLATRYGQPLSTSSTTPGFAILCFSGFLAGGGATDTERARWTGFCFDFGFSYERSVPIPRCGAKTFRVILLSLPKIPMISGLYEVRAWGASERT